MKRKQVEITQSKRDAIINAVTESPGMVPSEVRWHPAAHAVFAGEGVYLYLEELAKQGALYRHLRPRTKQFMYYVVPAGWRCARCEKEKDRRVSPSKSDESICGRCEAEFNGSNAGENHRNDMMDRYARETLVTGGIVDCPPSRYAVIRHIIDMDRKDNREARP